MPDFEFTSPQGKKYTVSGPPGSTPEQAFQILQAQIAAEPPEPKRKGADLIPGMNGEMLPIGGLPPTPEEPTIGGFPTEIVDGKRVMRTGRPGEMLSGLNDLIHKITGSNNDLPVIFPGLGLLPEGMTARGISGPGAKLAETLLDFPAQIGAAPARGALETGQKVAGAARKAGDALSRRVGGVADALVGDTAAEQTAGVKSTVQGAGGQAVGDLHAQADRAIQEAARQADDLRANARRQADAMRAQARGQSVAVQRQAEEQAQALTRQAEAQATKLTQDARAQTQRMRSVASKARSTGAGRLERAQAAVDKIGTRMDPTQLGDQARDVITRRMESLKGTREANAQANKTDAFGFALEREKRGEFISDTKAFKKLEKAIDDELVHPETGLERTTPDGARQLRKVRDILAGSPGQAPDPMAALTGATGTPGRGISTEAMEQLRRSLRDTASGQPPEGYEAISKLQAGRLADMVDAAINEFTQGKSEKFLRDYKRDSEALDAFRDRLGRAITGKEGFNQRDFAVDPKLITSRVVSSRRGIESLVEMAGDRAAAEQLVRGYVRDALGDAPTAKKVADLLQKHRDWLGADNPVFPALRRDLAAAERQLADAEKIATKRGGLAKTLETGSERKLTDAEKAAAKAREDAAKEAGKVQAGGAKAAESALAEGEKAASDTLAGAEKEGRSLGLNAQEKAAAQRAAADKIKKTLEKLTGAEGSESLSTSQQLADQLRDAGMIDESQYTRLLSDIRQAKAAAKTRDQARRWVGTAVAGVVGGEVAHLLGLY